MRILLLTHAFNSLTQRLFVELQDGGHELSVEFDINDQVAVEAVERFQPELIIALDSAAALQAWAGQGATTDSDLRHFLHIAGQLQLSRLERARDRFMSYGAYPGRGRQRFKPGVWDNGAISDLNAMHIREGVSHIWMQHQREPKHPFDGVSMPSMDRPDGYTPVSDGEKNPVAVQHIVRSFNPCMVCTVH